MYDDAFFSFAAIPQSTPKQQQQQQQVRRQSLLDPPTVSSTRSESRFSMTLHEYWYGSGRSGWRQLTNRLETNQRASWTANHHLAVSSSPPTRKVNNRLPQDQATAETWSTRAGIPRSCNGAGLCTFL